MAIFLMLLAVFFTGRGVQSLMEFPVLSYKEPAATGASVGSPSLGFSLDGPVLAMESLASHAEGALDELSNSMGIPFSKSKTKTNIHVGKGISSPQARPAAWILQGKEAKPSSPLQPPCSHLSSDQKLYSHKLPESLTKVDMYHASSNIALPLAPTPPKVDISTNHQYISLPKVDISTNRRDIPLPVKELNSNLSSKVQVNSYLMPASSHQQPVYAVHENPDSHIDGISTSATFVPLGVNAHHHSISSFYKQPQVFSHASGAPLSLKLSGPSYPTFGADSIANVPSPYVSGSVASHFSSSSPAGELPFTTGYVVPPVSPPHLMMSAVQNHSEIPLTETQLKVNSLYPNQQFPPYTYFPYVPFCHHSKSNLPPLSGSVLPRPFTVGYQPHQQPYYAATPQIQDDIYMPQHQQNYYYNQNEAVHQGHSAPANIHTSYNQ